MVSWSIDYMFKNGFLKKIVPSKERAIKSLEMAEKYLSEAGKDFNAGADMSAILTSYSCMFHSARAILFVDGIQERSHKAVCDYLKQKHPDFGIEFINSFDTHRELRHAVAYGIETVIKQSDAKNAINSAALFLARVKTYLKLAK